MYIDIPAIPGMHLVQVYCLVFYYPALFFRVSILLAWGCNELHLLGIASTTVNGLHGDMI